MFIRTRKGCAVFWIFLFHEIFVLQHDKSILYRVTSQIIQFSQRLTIRTHKFIQMTVSPNIRQTSDLSEQRLDSDNRIPRSDSYFCHLLCIHNESQYINETRKIKNVFLGQPPRSVAWKQVLRLCPSEAGPASEWIGHWHNRACFFVVCTSLLHLYKLLLVSIVLMT